MPRAFQNRQFISAGLKLLLILTLIEAGLGQSLRIPASIVEGLGADRFSVREAAQIDLKNWSRKTPDADAAATELLRQSREAPDPEVRSRCLTALKDFVIERHYRGEGYLGIRMQEEAMVVPGDAAPRRVIRVMLVMDGSPAAQGKVNAGDLIVGLNQTIWRQPGMAMAFGKAIGATRPGTGIDLVIFSEGKVVAKKVQVGEKPSFFNPAEGDVAAANEAAKDRFFEDWLDKHAADKR
jgi:predicted metalloprotease with PDZ domain